MQIEKIPILSWVYAAYNTLVIPLVKRGWRHLLMCIVSVKEESMSYLGGEKVGAKTVEMRDLHDETAVTIFYQPLSDSSSNTYSRLNPTIWSRCDASDRDAWLSLGGLIMLFLGSVALAESNSALEKEIGIAGVVIGAVLLLAECYFKCQECGRVESHQDSVRANP